MELEVLKNEEKMMNKIMFFLWGILVPVAAFIFVLFFLGGSMIDAVVFTMTGFCVLIRLFEGKLGKNAKYLYSCVMPICGVLIIVIANDGCFGGMTHAYILATTILIAYYDISVIKVNVIATLVPNIAAFIVFPESYLKMHKLALWVFIAIVYVLQVIVVVVITMRARKLFEQVEIGEKQTEKLLESVKTVSENLSEAGKSLLQISENESASAEELAATSQQLAESSNLLSSKTDESMNNLGELSQWESVVAGKVEQVETVSKELIGKSQENEKLLNELHTINGQVSESMKTTTDITKKLSEAVQEIGGTLDLISDISTSTNLLALNASIEAARAGESGKGFAVVATEVGKLAQNTQDSLKIVQAVIERVQQNVRDITAQVDENADKLDTQNEYFSNVFACMKDMTELLRDSVDMISTMGDAHGKQAEVIKKTVSINQDIAESIRNENEQFNAIHTMAESNAGDTADVATQASAINEMVEQMTRMLMKEA